MKCRFISNSTFFLFLYKRNVPDSLVVVNVSIQIKYFERALGPWSDAAARRHVCFQL